MKYARTLVRDPVAIIRLAMLLTAIAVLAGTPVDPDLWGHIRFGQDIVAARSIPRADTYSFTADRPWINHEWIAEVAMYGAYRGAGTAGLILLKLALDLGLLALVILHLRRYIAVRVTRDLLVALLILGILPRALSVRPQVFSLFLFGVLLTLLTTADRDRPRALLLAPFLMMVWVNVHGGWLVGLGTLGLWLAFRLVQPACSMRCRGLLLFVGCGSVAATLVNPYGVGMWRFLHQTVGFSRPDIVEWKPLYQLPLAFALTIWAPVAVSAVLLVLRAGRRNVAAYVAIAAMLGAASIQVIRLDAFFAIAVVMLLGASLGLTQSAPERPRELGATMAPTPAAVVVTFAMAGIVSMPVTITAHYRVFEIGLHRTWLPEPQAARFVLANQLRGRMINPFNWGEYAIWHFSPGLKMSLDGRRETVYSDGAVRAVYDFYDARPGALDYAARWGADYVWAPNDVAVLPVLERAGWRRVFQGPISSIFARPGDQRRYQQPVFTATSSSFPGP